MKKILLLTNEYYPHRGGIARYCYGLFRNFQPHEYVVATDQNLVSSETNRVRVQFTSRWVWPSWIVGVIRVLHVIRQHHIECIVTPNILPLGAIAWSLSFIRPIPYVVSLHGLDIIRAYKRRRFFTKLILKRARAVITNSEAVKKLVVPSHTLHPPHVIQPAIDTSFLTVNEHTRAALASTYADKKIILTVGRLVKRKGQDMVIQAMPHIIKKIPNAIYLMIGNGPDKAYLQSLIAEQNSGDICHILTDVVDSDLAAYYATASLFIMPARADAHDIEGFGIVYLEAAYFGLPIIAGRDGGANEAVGEDAQGIGVDGTSLGDIVEAVVTLLTDVELATYIGSRARERVLHFSDWQKQAERLRIIIENL